MKNIKKALYFSLNIISTILFINLLPKEYAQHLLANYAIASAIISLIVVYSMSVRMLFNHIKPIIILLLIFSLAHSIYEGVIYLITLYVCVFIIVDYIATQAYFEKKNKIRVISFSVNAMIPIFGIESLIVARIILGSIFILLYLISDSKLNILKIKNVNIVILKSNAIYFGTLYLIAVYSSINLQQVYTVFQIGLSYALKVYDFQLRNFHVEPKSATLFFTKVLGIAPMVFLYYIGTDGMIYFFYIFSYISLIRLERIL